MNSPKQCELCGKLIMIPGQLKGICHKCDEHLCGGKYSAQIVKAEAKTITQRKIQRNQ